MSANVKEWSNPRKAECEQSLPSEVWAVLSNRPDMGGRHYLCKWLNGGQRSIAIESLAAFRKVRKAPQFDPQSIAGRFAELNAIQRRAVGLLILSGRIPAVQDGNLIGITSTTVESIKKLTAVQRAAWAEVRAELAALYGVETLRALYPRDDSGRRVGSVKFETEDDSDAEDAPMTDSLTGNSETEVL